MKKTTGTILTFEDITEEFIDDENDVFCAEKILTRLLDDILPHLLQYNCKIIVDSGIDNKDYFFYLQLMITGKILKIILIIKAKHSKLNTF